jgi:hypothetical protein
MADRYWVGGSGTWDSSSTTNWSSTSGGAPGASAPTLADNAYFDGASDTGAAFTVTVSEPVSCLNLIIGDGTTVSALDQAMTLAGNVLNFNVHGSLFFPTTNFTRTITTTFIMFAESGSHTITTNGKSLAAASSGSTGIQFGSPALQSNATFTLGSALTIATGTTEFASGSFDTANYNFTSSSAFIFREIFTKSLTLGSSTIAIGIVNNAFVFTSGANSTNTTINAGTSTITFNGPSTTLNGGLTTGGFNFYNVRFLSQSAGTTTINGTNTFNNFEQRNRSATGIRNIQFNGDQIINGTLTLGAANTAIRRMFVHSDEIGTTRTITLNGSLATLADVNFKDITTAGTAGTWTGTRLGNAGNVSGITTDAPKTIYWNLAGSQNWSATGWATTNNGAPNVNNFPLPQDTATFTEAGDAGTVTVDQAWQIGSIQMADGVSNRTTGFTLATGTIATAIYGDVTLFSGLTLTGTGALTFASHATTQNITTAGVTFTQPIIVDLVNGIFKLSDALTQGATIPFTIVNGTIELKDGVTTTVGSFGTSGSNQKFLQSTTPGVQATLSQASGTVSVSNLTIRDINATGGATWNAFVTNNNVDAGNNTGWDFFTQLGKYIYTRRKNKRILL